MAGRALFALHLGMNTSIGIVSLSHDWLEYIRGNTCQPCVPTFLPDSHACQGSRYAWQRRRHAMRLWEFKKPYYFSTPLDTYVVENERSSWLGLGASALRVLSIFAANSLGC